MSMQSDGQADKAKQDARQHADALGSKASAEAARVAETARDAGKQRAEQGFEQGKQVAEGHVDAVQHAVDDAAKRLQDEDHPFASYATELSSQLSSLSDRIESSSFDELVRDGRRVARTNPGLFMLGAVAVGFAASRFLKASERHDESDYIDLNDEDEDDVHERYMSRSTQSYPEPDAQPYRRAASVPVTPVPRDSSVGTGSVVGTPGAADTSSAGSSPAIARPSPTSI